ncbi:hypothetical protein BKA70DRAFT_1494947 [Coprinopsis sp. MPI-PUGE-AT-0042]|nr:hypothetical protein BKA70DRAFT_1466196 [Coprinopsis sp. MPI-PUGE-AT-0042]KAH6906582.1 hypothetical protein BKA70DRAFT_1494947 [Coprinopsis sp. MPI-PUGE-AT-0042]
MDATHDVNRCANEPAPIRTVNDGPLSFPLEDRASLATTPGTPEAQSISNPVSTIFFPGSPAVVVTPNCAVKSSDGVLFYINANVLTSAGALNFPSTPIEDGRTVTHGPIAQVPETSPTLTVILCAVYGIPCDSTTPSIEDISTAIDRMPLNGLRPKALIQKGSPLYLLLITRYVPIRALTVYAIAAQHDIEALAQDASAHLLGLEVDDIDDLSTVKMGSMYFMRLVLLNTNRVKALKRIVLETNPAFHTLDKEGGCTKEKQEEMRSHWVRTMTQLTWEVKSDISPSTIREACRLAAEDVPCGMCKKAWDDCVEEVVVQWVQVKNTI